MTEFPAYERWNQGKLDTDTALKQLLTDYETIEQVRNDMVLVGEILKEQIATVHASTGALEYAVGNYRLEYKAGQFQIRKVEPVGLVSPRKPRR